MKDREAWCASIGSIGSQKVRQDLVTEQQKQQQVVKNLPASLGDIKRYGFSPWIGKIPWSVKWQPAPVLLPGKLHGQRSLAGCSLWGHEESMTQLNIHTSSFEPSFFLPFSQGSTRQNDQKWSGISFIFFLLPQTIALNTTSNITSLMKISYTQFGTCQWFCKLWKDLGT